MAPHALNIVRPAPFGLELLRAGYLLGRGRKRIIDEPAQR